MRGLWNDLSGAFGHAVSLRHKTKMRRVSISDLARFQFGMLVRRKIKSPWCILINVAACSV